MVPPEGFLLDVDGVIVEAWKALPGAVETIDDLRSRRVPFRFITNTTAKTRRELAETLGSAGFEVDEVFAAPRRGAATDGCNQPRCDTPRCWHAPHTAVCSATVSNSGIRQSPSAEVQP